MNRRAFLTGLFGAAIATQLPATKVLEVASTADWEAIMQAVLDQYVQDFMLYGMGAVRYIETFPYIENVDPSTLRAFDPGPPLPFIH